MKLLTDPRFLLALIGNLYRKVPDPIRGYLYSAAVVVLVGYVAWSVVHGDIGLEQLVAAISGAGFGMAKSHVPDKGKRDPDIIGSIGK